MWRLCWSCGSAPGSDHFHRLARFWTKIFAVSFAMGVVSGIPLSYQFGTNWARFSEVAGNVIGPLIGYEVLTAFFLEATFLGVMLFGWQRVAPWLHVTAAILVALGTAISGFWILAANSWMHTPDGYILHDGIAYPTSWLHVIFNPSFPYRFAHMMTAAYLTTSVVVLAAGARYLIRSEFETEGRTMMRMGVGMLAILGPLQLLLGDQHGLNTLQHQPAKIAAIEAHWDDDGPADLVLFALPDEIAERNRAQIAIPHLGSMILTHKWDGRFAGLKDFPRNQRPPGDLDLLRLPGDGGCWHYVDSHRVGGCGVVVAQEALHHEVVSPHRRARLVAGLHRDPGGVAHYRERSPALCRLRNPPHRGRVVAREQRRHCNIADVVCAGLLCRVFHRDFLHPPAHLEWPEGRGGEADGPAGRVAQPTVVGCGPDHA